MEPQPREIQEYQTLEGTMPFTQWLESLRDLKTRVKIEKRLERVRIGNSVDYLSVGEGVCELKIDFSPGYRIYFSQIGTKIILILLGGSKKTQEQDIEKAKEYWRDYERRESTNQ
jgi:putative addiction module killer protein